jgi:hypothetical protein
MSIPVRLGSVRARAARPFYPQKTSSACPRHVRLVPTNERGKRYAVLPFIRSGYRTESDEEEVLPILDPRRHRIGVCEAVMQRVPIEEVSSAHFAYSIETIMTIDELKKALIQRYAPLFPHLRPEQLLSRGCAITLIRFRDAW